MPTVLEHLGDSVLHVLDAADSGSLWADTGGTVPAVDGGPVNRWDGGGLSLLPVATAPTYRADYLGSGFPAVEFSGSGAAYLTGSSAELAALSDRYVIAVVARDAAASGTDYMMTLDGTWRLYGTGTLAAQQYLGGSKETLSAIAGPIGSLFVALFRSTAGWCFTWTGSRLVAAEEAAAPNAGNGTIWVGGDRGTSLNAWHGPIHKMIIGDASLASIPSIEAAANQARLDFGLPANGEFCPPASGGASGPLGFPVSRLIGC